MIDPNRYGVSFSVKQCKALDIDSSKALEWLISTAGFRRFRLMSYWNEIEKEQGIYDFTELDNQFKTIGSAGGYITLCLGVRQPRWPENHWPEWALILNKPGRYEALANFIKIIVHRYKDHPSLMSYQLENEALNRNFGKNGDFDRKRIANEYNLVKSMDPKKPIIMSMSNSWGLPILGPVPDIVGLSVYTIRYNKNMYTHSKLPAWFYRARINMIKRPCFIHELQAEPWGHKQISDMNIADQNRVMPIQRIQSNVKLAKEIGFYPIDFWGGEWWYRRWEKFNDSSIYTAVVEAITS